MGSLVFELRADACDESVNVLNLLRKAQVVSTLLKVRSISEWLRQEMEGYDLNEEIPEYRKVTGRIMYRHPRNGYMPVDMGHAELEKMISSMTLRNPLSEFYETIALSDNDRKSVV